MKKSCLCMQVFGLRIKACDKTRLRSEISIKDHHHTYAGHKLVFIKRPQVRPEGGQKAGAR